MKQLSKEQLSEMVHDTIVSVYKSNEGNLMKKISDSAKDANNPCTTVVNAMAVLGAEIMWECNQTLVETLYNILYTE